MEELKLLLNFSNEKTIIISQSVFQALSKPELFRIIIHKEKQVLAIVDHNEFTGEAFKIPNTFKTPDKDYKTESQLLLSKVFSLCPFFNNGKCYLVKGTKHSKINAVLFPLSNNTVINEAAIIGA